MTGALHLLDPKARIQALQLLRGFRRNHGPGLDIPNDEEGGCADRARQAAVVGVGRLQHLERAHPGLQSRVNHEFDHLGRAMRVPGAHIGQHFVPA